MKDEYFFDRVNSLVLENWLHVQKKINCYDLKKMWLSWYINSSFTYFAAKDGQPTPQQIDREERLRLIKEKQNEERQKKLEELKQQVRIPRS